MTNLAVLLGWGKQNSVLLRGGKTDFHFEVKYISVLIWGGTKWNFVLGKT